MNRFAGPVAGLMASMFMPWAAGTAYDDLFSITGGSHPSKATIVAHQASRDSAVHLVTTFSHVFVPLFAVLAVVGAMRWIFDLTRGYPSATPLRTRVLAEGETPMPHQHGDEGVEECFCSACMDQDWDETATRSDQQPDPTTEHRTPDARRTDEPEATDPVPVAPRPASRAETIAATWNHAFERHMEVRDAYSEIITDPLNALDHTALFDMTQTRTAAFIEAYAHCQDIVSIHSSHDPGPEYGRRPKDSSVIEEYATAVRKMKPLWDAALSYSRKAGPDWMPEGDQRAARKAASLLRTSRDEAATDAERALAAEKAKETLNTIASFDLPAEAMRAIEQQATRKAILGPDTNGQTGKECA